MSGSEPASIVVVDLRRERAELLRVLLAPLGRVRVETSVASATTPSPALVVVDPPATGLTAERWRALRRSCNGLPLLVLGAVPEPGTAANQRGFAGALLPSRLRAVAGELLRIALPPGRDWLHALASCLPLGPEQTRLLVRAAAARVTVLLSGEPGSGKTLLARAYLTAPGARLHRVEAPLPGSLGAELRAMPPGSTLYLSGLEEIGPSSQAELFALLDEPGEDRPRIAIAAQDAAVALAGVRDDLRLHLETISLQLAPLRREPEALPELFERTLAALALRHDLVAPQLAPETARALVLHPWPLNFEELVAVATRTLLHAAGGQAEPRDLGLGTAAIGPIPARSRPVGIGTTPRSLDALVQDLAHQIKNPLVSIKTFTQLLDERHQDGDFREEFQRVVLCDIDRIDGVLAEMADFTRLRDPLLEPVDLAQVLRRTIDRQPALTRRPSLRVVIREPEHPVSVETDEHLLGYALECSLREVLNVLADGSTLEATVLGPRSGDARSGAGLLLRFRGEAEPVRPARGHRRGRRREVLGLRHTLAAYVLDLLGGHLEIEDSLQGETRIAMVFE